MIPVFVGYDPREPVTYSVFCHSVISRTKARVAFYPMRGGKVEGSTTFNPERFNVARDMGYRGWAIWADGDMLCRADIEELLAYADPYCDVVLAKHDYRTKHPVKFLGQPNPDYPRKNWSSLMLINCVHASWERIAYGYRDKESGERKSYTLSDLHRFKFVDDARIGALPLEWNWLVSEYPYNLSAKLVHFTIGTPCWAEYAACDYAEEWHAERDRMLYAKPYAEEPQTAEAATAK